MNQTVKSNITLSAREFFIRHSNGNYYRLTSSDFPPIENVLNLIDEVNPYRPGMTSKAFKIGALQMFNLIYGDFYPS